MGKIPSKNCYFGDLEITLTIISRSLEAQPVYVLLSASILCFVNSKAIPFFEFPHLYTVVGAGTTGLQEKKGFQSWKTFL